MSCWGFSRHSFFFAEKRRKDENKRPQTLKHEQISKTLSSATSPARSDAGVQHVDVQFGKSAGVHLRFASAARECLVMKSEILPTFLPSNNGPWFSLIRDFSQRERGFRTATHRIFVRIANRLRPIMSAGKKTVLRQPKRHSPNLVRGGATCGAGDPAEVPLRTEEVVSFAAVSCTRRSIVDYSSTISSMTGLMPVGYIERRNVLFHKPLLAHEHCGMNRLQESREHSQISPRTPLRSPASFKDSLEQQQ